MSQQRILIVYGSTHGQTAKIGRHIGDLLGTLGRSITLADADALPPALDPRDFDGVIVGSSITWRRHQPAVLRFVRAHRDALSAKPSAFYSVSASAAGRTEEERDGARRCVNDFLRQTGWRPGVTATLGGAMAYTRYNPVLRWVTRHIAAKAGGPTDTSRDHELTDWAWVRRFVEDFALLLPRLVETPVVPRARPAPPPLAEASY